MTQMDVQPAARAETRSAADRDPVIEMRDISIAFGGVQALDRSSLRLLPGEVHALMGENGAGKSTLIKALTGVYTIDSGTDHWSTATSTSSAPRRHRRTPASAPCTKRSTCCPNLTVAENMLLGREPRRFGGINFRAMNRRARATAREPRHRHRPQLRARRAPDRRAAAGRHRPRRRRRGAGADPRRADLQPGRRRGRRSCSEVMRRLRDQGVAIVFVSHFLDQVYEISDRMTVLRNGQLVEERMVADTTQLELVKLMIGRELEALDRLDRKVSAADARTSRGAPVLKALGVGRKGSLRGRPTSSCTTAR